MVKNCDHLGRLGFLVFQKRIRFKNHDSRSYKILKVIFSNINNCTAKIKLASNQTPTEEIQL